MPRNTFNFTLLNPAKNKGGDKYVTEIGKGHSWIIYIPQKFSRPAGRPVHDMTVVLHAGGINPEDFQHDETT